MLPVPRAQACRRCFERPDMAPKGVLSASKRRRNRFWVSFIEMFARRARFWFLYTAFDRKLAVKLCAFGASEPACRTSDWSPVPIPCSALLRSRPRLGKMTAVIFLALGSPVLGSALHSVAISMRIISGGVF